MRNTIFALSSGRLPSGVAVIRLSGPDTIAIFKAMVGRLTAPRHASLVKLRAKDGGLLDQALAFWFPAPASFTGEDCAEFHVHGGPAVVQAVMRELGSFPGLRVAEPGEFSRRAYLHGKFDLAQAEALGDLIAAETDAQRRFALQNADGRQGVLYRAWRERMIRARAWIEAELDFSDEGDVPQTISQGVWGDVQALCLEVERHCTEFHKSEIIREGLDVVIAGAPNAGKSSLLNALARRDVAIVSPLEGTTRDLIEVSLDVAGYKIRVTDTAGLRDGSDPLEMEGITRARKRLETADVVLHLADCNSQQSAVPISSCGEVIRVGTKSDLGGHGSGCFHVMISTVSGEGISELLALLEARAMNLVGAIGVAPSQERHVALLRVAAAHMKNAITGDLPIEVAAEELRLASDSIGRITGDIDVEDLLGAVFANFCIGK